jgi:hypothetical protein
MINNLKGGKFIGQGTYGCVYANPSLKCNDSPYKNRPYRHNTRVKSPISKLMRRSDLIREEKQLKEVDRIDTKFLYHYGINDVCLSPKWQD